MKVITFKAEEELIDLLDSYAINHGLNRSEVIRMAIEKLVEEEKKKEPRARVEKGIRL